MATANELEVDALTRELIALRKQAESRSTPDPRLNKQIMDIQQQLMKRKAAGVSAPTTAMKKGGMVKKQAAKVKKVMGEFKEGKLHSGKKGPVVKSRKQAVAIALSEARKAKKK